MLRLWGRQSSLRFEKLCLTANCFVYRFVFNAVTRLMNAKLHTTVHKAIK